MCLWGVCSWPSTERPPRSMRFCCCSMRCCCNVQLLLLQGTSASYPHGSSLHVLHLRPELQARIEPAQSHHKTPGGETQERGGKKGWPPKAAVQISYFLWLIYMTGFIYCLRFRFLLQTNWLHCNKQNFLHSIELDSNSNPNCQLNKCDGDPNQNQNPNM